MKNKSNRHKETNTFQFKPFTKRIAEIDIDIFHRVAHRNEERSEEVETYFHQTLQKWNVLNLTDGYTTFKKQVRDIVTLPHLLHKKQYVIDKLMEYLKMKNILFLQPILELIVAVARDLQNEFYEYFPQFLLELICLLQTKLPEQIEYIFTTLAYLFKILWRYLVKNIRNVVILLLPLLTNTQPVYINRFAAESFAFVVRKIKDKDSFLRLMLHIIEDNINGVSGSGKLLFEVIAGTTGHFHSCAKQMLLLYFNALEDESVNQKLTYEVIKEVIAYILQNIHPQRCNIMWDVILDVIDKFVESKQSLEISERDPGLLLFLRLIHVIISYNNGRFLTDAIPLIKKLTIIIDLSSNDNNILQEAINVSVAILLAPNTRLMQEISSQLLFKIVAVNNIEILYSAVENLMYDSSFETLILPCVLRRSISIGFDDKTLSLFAKIITAKASPCLGGITLNKWRKYILDIQDVKLESINYFSLELKTLFTDVISLDAMRILIILPHMKPLHEEFKEILKNGLLSIYKKILNYDNNIENTADINKITFIFLLTLETIMHILEPNHLHKFLIKSNIKIIELVNKYCDNIYILNAIDLCLTYFVESQYHTNYINLASFEILNDNVVKKMSSPYSQIRLTVAHLYSLFTNVKELRQSTQYNGKSAMELVYLVEYESATVQKYRDKLLHLQGLEFQSDAIINLDSKYYEFPLRCLIGNLYLNFSLLWEPVSIAIASYANKKCTVFWQTFFAELMMFHSIPETEWKSLFDCPIISSLEMSIEKYNDKPDFENHKLLLWKCMTHFSSYAETKNRDLTGLFIDFVNTNLFKSNSEDGKSYDIEKRKKLSDTNNEMENESDDEEQDDTFSNVKATQSNRERNTNYKMKFLIAQMNIFAKMINPNMLYKETEMHQIYLELLSSRNADVQKAALNCLCAYKYKYLLPYKESLYGLINEKNFKNELTRFNLDQENNVIQEEHRVNLMPIIMRIIYAKMITKIGMRTGGKAGGFARRRMILRFLSGTKESEMIMFIRMAFKPFKAYISIEMDKALNLKQHTEEIIHGIDLNNVTPPKRMQSAVNLLAIVMEEFGGKMTRQLLPNLLGILISILAEITGILQKSEDIYPGYLPAIKTVRTNCINILARFFMHFENYNWKQHEIDALFNVTIFPWLQKLPIESIHSPTALLKLFMAWGQNPRYYPLFVKYQENNESISALPYIIQLLMNSKTHRSVINAILEIIEKMLTLENYGKSNEDEHEMEVDMPFISLIPVLTNLLEIDDKILSSGVNYGSTILLPHIPHILEFIKRELKKSNKSINKIELIILSRISEFVSNAETCDVLLTLMVPILIKKAMFGEDEETIIGLLMTVINLIKNVNKPEIHIRSITPLLSVVSPVPTRKLLMRLYSLIAEKSLPEHREAMIKNCNILISLNAWDHKWVEQPDFQKRLDAFKEINEMIEKKAITLEFGVAIIHNCFHFLKVESDLAIRDYSGQCLKLVGLKLAKEHKIDAGNRRYLIDDTILAITRKGITSKNEVIRLQSIAFLGYMAMECPDVHPILRDLSLLTNRDDPEVDFFENMQHLQLHRKARALLKFCALAKTLEKSMNPKTLTQFVLPLCSSYVCNESYIHKNSIVDAAIETIGVICKLLPWYHYEIVLKYYLGKLRNNIEFQKQLVRIVVVILDSFHYDLSKYKAAEENAQQKLISTICKDTPSTCEEEINETSNEEKNREDTIQNAEEKLNEALNNDKIESVEEITKKDDKMIKESIPIIEKQILLSQYGAKRVMFSISNDLLPQLHRSIMARTRRDVTHKMNKKSVNSQTEEDDLMRVPIALALVKLLQKMPENVLNANLPGIFMKLCTFLKSRMESVRRMTRTILQKIMITLGPKYLHYFLREMNTSLTKGFQIHVLAYTIQSVLSVLKSQFQQFDINDNLQSILSVCKIDLFGLTAEEKEIAGIVKNVSEAKSTKSFDIFHILAEFITESCLLDLVSPLKEMLLKTHSHKTVHKIVECLRNVTLGLADNNYISLEKMLIFLYGIISESIPDFMPVKENKFMEQSMKDLMRQKKPNSLLIPPEPKSRIGIKTAAKTTKSINIHIMIEFGLKLYHILLKRNKISGPEYKPYLEPIVPLLNDCINSQHVKIITVSLQCLNWMLKMDLASVHSLMSNICTTIFTILHKYAAPGLSKGDNFDLVMATFKCVSVIIRDVKYFDISADQLKMLLLYAEQDLYDSTKQSTAFTLLKAIINRKMIISEMHAIMEKVSMLSITSELEHVRLQSRSVFYSYLMEYPLGKHLDKHISFYLTQLSYEMQSGRLSALEMMHTVITGFPLKALTTRSGFIFLMMSARLINDNDPTCRKLCAKCIKEMIIRISFNERNKLFDVVFQWLNDSKMIHRTLAAQLCGMFVSIEKDEFESRLTKVLPLLLKQFHAKFSVSKDAGIGRFVKLDDVNDEKIKHPDLKDSERMKDHYLFQVLQLLLKMSAYCTSFLTSEEYIDSVRLFAEYSQSLLAHPHIWVRLAAAQLIGFILAALDIDKIAQLLNNPESDELQENYIYPKPSYTFRSLTLDLIAQLHSDMTFEELADQVVKNLIFIAKILKSTKEFTAKNGESGNESKTDDNKNLSLSWLIRRLRKAINIEITQTPKSTSVRTAVFKCFAGIVVTIPRKYLNAIIFNIMSPLVREITITEGTNTDLRRLAKEVTTMVKKSLGNEDYTILLQRVQQKFHIRRAERKRIFAQQFVTDPDLAAKRKILRQQKKKEAKKRKLDVVRGKKATKKHRKKEVNLDEL